MTIKAAPTAPFSAEALQAAIFNSVVFSSIATDADGVIQIFNVGAERMLGYTAAQAVEHLTPADLSDPLELIGRAEALSLELGTAIRPGFEALVFKASRGIEDIYELTCIRGDQTRFPALVSVTALRDPDDAIIGYLLIMTDDTVRKEIEDTRRRYEQALQLKNAELEEASRLKSEFLANMSHELRTPLNAVIGFSEVLRDGLVGDLTERQRSCADDIYGSGKHLLSLINDILDLSKVEAGKMTLDLEAVEVSPLFVNSLTIIREKAAARRIQMRIDIPVGMGHIEADGRKLKQIVYNLLSNAVKFTLDGGQVTLTAGTAPRADVGRISDPETGRALPLPESEFEEFLWISVTDSGIGIHPSSLDLLFVPFSQVDAGLSRRFEGTGLGLVMIRALAELHGGTVAVESTVGMGSKFTVWIPLRPANLQHVDHRTPLVGAAGGKRMALVVEDDIKSAGLIRMQLEAEGFEVVHAASAEAALVLALQQPPSLVTLDIMLPEMDGWEFLARFKQVPGLSRVPVVIISIVADRNRGMALGAAAVLQKPVSRQDLYEALTELDLLPLSTGKPLRVLIADDDPKSVELIASRFTGLATTILRAFGGQEAIEMTRKELPDLLVLDVVMPDVTGFDVVDALRDDDATRAIPILIVTSRTITFEDRSRLSSRVSAIMQKVDFDHRFLTEVHRAVASRKGAA